MRLTTFSLFLFYTITNCSTNTNGSVKLNLEGSFKSSALTNPVQKIKAYKESIYAGTSQGLYKTDSSENHWNSMGLPNGNIHAFVVLSETEALASVSFANTDSATIAKTTNSGQNWLPSRNGYSGNLNNQVPTAITAFSSDPQLLLAGGPGGLDIAKLINSKWELVLGSWENLGFLKFIKVDNFSPAHVWAGGANAAFQAALVKSTDEGSSWQQIQVYGVEANVYNVIIHPSDQNQILAGLGGNTSSANVIRKSTDGGESWQTVLEGYNTRTLTHSARNPEIVYASGINESGTLFFAASANFGESWEIVEWEESPAGVQVNDMVSVMEDGREVLYFGTNKGVFSYAFEE